jgi:hypothetical protein
MTGKEANEINSQNYCLKNEIKKVAIKFISFHLQD